MKGDLSRSLVPRPEVLHLPTLFRRVAEGEVRIPAFQRGLVWNNEQVRALLDSVYLGYPIGSLLLWHARSDMFAPYIPPDVQMPKEPAGQEVLDVLDGMQRLVTLYAAFNGGGGPEHRFELFFDLEERKFYHATARRPGNVLHKQIALKRVFTPRLFIEDQAALANLPDADQWLGRAVDLHARFQEYALPIISIVRASSSEAVKIFMNINRGGSDLSTVDFMRALTWHNEFDLTHAVSRIKDALPAAFNPDDETIAKTIALFLDVDPVPDTILRLQDIPLAALNGGITQAQRALIAVAEFLHDSFGFASADFVPYEGQVLVLARVLGHTAVDEQRRQSLQKWFLASSFSEALQGRPDHFIIRLVKESVISIEQGTYNLDLRLELEPGELSRKQLRKGTAISSGFFALLSLMRARSVYTGELIDRADYLDSFDASKLAHIVPRQRSKAGVQRRLMNLVLISSDEAYVGPKPGELEKALFRSSDEVLGSQLLDRRTIELLQHEDYEAAFRHRAELVCATIESFLRQ